ncbi:hypothetical protein B0H21DRAFT_193979 [Amylocystis lapponica]|nr:hypothetical protein B0H21DRAFT_193979 [Amylocystis lapponica]
MRAVYAPLGPKVTVEPLRFNESELDAQAFLSMMAIGDSVPLYMQIILSILRELGEKYSYQKFMTVLDQQKKKFNPQQLTGLEQRMSLLQSFLDKKKGREAPARFAPGQLTIIDLSDPFIDPASACGFFEIVTRLFVRANVDTGKVLVVDEAHKGAIVLVLWSREELRADQELLSLIRQQRHQAMRVIISTQEPTVVPPVLLDLCSVTILHRFSSPTWWAHVAKHVSADVSNNDAFDRVVHLQTGQALLLSAPALGVFRDDGDKAHGSLSQFGRRCVLIKTRKRITTDGGASLLVVDP